MLVVVKMMKDKRGMKPLLLKLGVALAISFAGFLYSHLRNRRINSNPSPPLPPPSVDKKIDVSAKEECGSTPTTGDGASISHENYEEASPQKITNSKPTEGFTFSRNQSLDEEEFLLPEFNDLVLKEFEITSNNTGISPRKDIDTPVTSKNSAEREMEKEIQNLKNLVLILRERERKLEMQLLEYYGLKEQETAVRELQNRLKLNSMEAKLFILKIESLKADKQRLEAQIADHSKVMAELESARAKIKMLKRKIRLDEEQTKEQLSTLQHKVSDLQNQEPRTSANDVDIEMNLQRLKKLEEESAELRLANSRLLYENSELARRLESTQILATSVLEHPEAEALQETNHCLRKENEDLAKEIERLQANRCADVEELVYLRWVNACLRFELRNYQAPPGKTVARDLSKNLSPRSEEKAKKLILEYANSEGMGDRCMLDFDSGYWSSSQDSYLTESVDLDDSSVEISSASKTNSSSKSKFFSKLSRLVHGKDSPKHNQSSLADRSSSYATSGRRESISTASFDEMAGTCGSTASSQHNSIMSTTDHTEAEARADDRRYKTISRSQSLSRASLDIQRVKNLSLESIQEVEGNRRNSDVYMYKRMVLKNGSDDDLAQENRGDHDPDATEKLELMKFAEVLKGSNSSPRSHTRSSSNRSY